MTWVTIAILIAAAIVGNTLLIKALKKSQKDEAALQALATEKGWRYNRLKSTTRVTGYSELIDDTAGWTLRIYAGSSDGSSRFTLWTDPGLALPSGLAVYAAPLPEKTQTMINLMMDKAGGLGRVMLDTVFKGLGPEARNLRAIEDDDPATLMATEDAEHAFDPLKNLPELRLLNQFGTNIAEVPFLVRSTDGLSLRLNSRLKSTEDLLLFIEAAQTLAAKLRA